MSPSGIRTTKAERRPQGPHALPPSHHGWLFSIFISYPHCLGELMAWYYFTASKSEGLSFWMFMVFTKLCLYIFILYCFRLTLKEVDEMLQKMPKLDKNSEYFFRNLGNNGIISFRWIYLYLTIQKGHFVIQRQCQWKNIQIKLIYVRLPNDLVYLIQASWLMIMIIYL